VPGDLQRRPAPPPLLLSAIAADRKRPSRWWAATPSLFSAGPVLFAAGRVRPVCLFLFLSHEHPYAFTGRAAAPSIRDNSSQSLPPTPIAGPPSGPGARSLPAPPPPPPVSPRSPARPPAPPAACTPHLSAIGPSAHLVACSRLSMWCWCYAHCCLFLF
jgi:hypothetical protein